MDERKRVKALLFKSNILLQLKKASKDPNRSDRDQTRAADMFADWWEYPDEKLFVRLNDLNGEAGELERDMIRHFLEGDSELYDVDQDLRFRQFQSIVLETLKINNEEPGHDEPYDIMRARWSNIRQHFIQDEDRVKTNTDFLFLHKTVAKLSILAARDVGLHFRNHNIVYDPFVSYPFFHLLDVVRNLTFTQEEADEKGTKDAMVYWNQEGMIPFRYAHFSLLNGDENSVTLKKFLRTDIEEYVMSLKDQMFTELFYDGENRLRAWDLKGRLVDGLKTVKGKGANVMRIEVFEKLPLNMFEIIQDLSHSWRWTVDDFVADVKKTLSIRANQEEIDQEDVVLENFRPYFFAFLQRLLLLSSIFAKSGVFLRQADGYFEKLQNFGARITDTELVPPIATTDDIATLEERAVGRLQWFFTKEGTKKLGELHDEQGYIVDIIGKLKERGKRKALLLKVEDLVYERGLHDGEERGESIRHRVRKQLRTIQEKLAAINPLV